MKALYLPLVILGAYLNSPLQASPSVVKLSSFHKQNDVPCEATVPSQNERRGSAVIVRLADSQTLYAVTSAHVPFHGGKAQDICHKLTAEDGSIAFVDLAGVQDLIDLAVLKFDGLTDWHKHALILDSIPVASNNLIGQSSLMIGYPFGSDKPAHYNGRIDLVDSVRSTLIGTRVVEVFSQDAIASEFGMSGGGAFADKDYFVGLITAQYLEYPDQIPLAAELVERGTPQNSRDLKTLILPQAAITSFLVALGKPETDVLKIDIRQSLTAQLLGERSIQFEGLSFTEIKCGKRTAIDGLETFSSQPDRGGVGGGREGGGHGGGVGGGHDQGRSYSCSIHVARASDHETKRPWPFENHRSDILEFVNITNTVKESLYIDAMICPGESQERAIQNLRSMLYDFSQGCRAIFSNSHPPQASRPKLFDASMQQARDASAQKIGTKKNEIAASWSQLQPQTRWLFWSNLDEEGKRELIEVVSEQSKNLSLRKEIESYRKHYAKIFVDNNFLTTLPADKDYVTMSGARRYWLTEAAKESDHQIFYDHLSTLGDKYQFDEGDLLWDVAGGPFIRQDLWNLYARKRQDITAFAVNQGYFKKTIEFEKPVKINTIFVFTTTTCPIKAHVTFASTTDGADLSNLTPLNVDRDGFREAMTLVGVDYDVYVSRIDVEVYRDMTIAPDKKCGVAVQGHDGRFSSLTKTPEEEPLVKAFSWTKSVSVSPNERQTADAFLQVMFDLRVLMSQHALLLLNKK
jgi:hypothetical protein